MIHPTAVIHPKAQLDDSIDVCPYVVIDADVVMGPGCKVGPHVYITGHTRIGANNRFYAGCVVGEATVVGSNNFLMVNSHIGHNAVLGDHVILANGALLAGHVQVENNVFISGNCLVHQFVRVGRLSIMQGGSAISLDLPPYTVARGTNGICGLNIVGLRRAGMSPEDRLELKKLYHKLFRSGRNLEGLLAEARQESASAPARAMVDFVASAKRGVCRDVSAMRQKIVDEDEGNID